MTFQNYFSKLKIISIILALFLSSCYNTTFDNVEYFNTLIFKYQMMEVKNNCSTDNLKNKMDLANKNLNLMFEYSKYRHDRAEIYHSITVLQTMLTQLYSKYNQKTMSPAYCDIKSQNIIEGTDILLEGMGNLD